MLCNKLMLWVLFKRKGIKTTHPTKHVDLTTNSLYHYSVISLEISNLPISIVALLLKPTL